MSDVPFVPLYAKLLITKDPDKLTTAGGFYIPDSAKEKPESGTIIAAGHGRLLASGEVIPLQVKAGDHVVFAKWAGTEIKVEGISYLLMDEEDVFGFDPKTHKGEVPSE
jgi:chaperonin GroES